MPSSSYLTRMSLLVAAVALASCGTAPPAASPADTPAPSAAPAPAADAMPPAAPPPAAHPEPAPAPAPAAEMPASNAPMSVREAQQRLTELGYKPGVADGKAGPRTREALKLFQKDNGMPPTGQLDAETMQRLRSARAAR